MQLSSFAVQLAGGLATQLLQRCSLGNPSYPPIATKCKTLQLKPFQFRRKYSFYRTKPRNTYPSPTDKGKKLDSSYCFSACFCFTKQDLYNPPSTSSNRHPVCPQEITLFREEQLQTEKIPQSTPNQKPSLTSQLRIFTDK